MEKSAADFATRDARYWVVRPRIGLSGISGIEAVWSVRSLKGGAAMTCTSRLSEPVGPGYDSLVQGHQQAIARLADEVARVARAVHAGQTPTCP